MGRPIHKKYFGNLNVPPIGGESVASIAVGGADENVGYVQLPTLQLSAPTLPGGVQATARAHMAVIGITNFFAGTSGYSPNQVLTLTGGTGISGTITVTSTAVASASIVNGGQNYVLNDVVEIDGGTTTSKAQIKITGVDAGVATAVEIVGTGGVYTSNPTLSEVGVTGGTGNGLTLNLNMKINTASVTTGGDYTVLPADVTIVGHSGAGGALFNLTFKVLSAEVTNSGGGYASTPSVTEDPDKGATYTVTMTATAGNAISISANVTGAGAKAGDIVKQEGSHKYLVTTTDGTGQCSLVAEAPNAEGQMTMTAKDSAGGTYYVLKLTARRALIVKGDRTGVQFVTGTDGISIPWIFAPNTAVENESVEIVSA